MNNYLGGHYQNLLKTYGDSAESAQYSSRETQERRFKYLIQIGSIEGKSILDFGCGTGHLATYLKNHNINVQYTGVDIVEDFFTIAKSKHPEHRFGFLENFSGEKFDYIFISGVFNNKIDDNKGYYENYIKDLFKFCRCGMAFNMMSSYVDYYDDDLFYERPETIFEYIKRNVTPYVTLRHDYEVKPGIVPFEFIIYAYKYPAL